MDESPARPGDHDTTYSSPGPSCRRCSTPNDVTRTMPVPRACRTDKCRWPRMTFAPRPAGIHLDQRLAAGQGPRTRRCSTPRRGARAAPRHPAGQGTKSSSPGPPRAVYVDTDAAPAADAALESTPDAAFHLQFESTLPDIWPSHRTVPSPAGPATGSRWRARTRAGSRPGS